MSMTVLLIASIIFQENIRIDKVENSFKEKQLSYAVLSSDNRRRKN